MWAQAVYQRPLDLKTPTVLDPTTETKVEGISPACQPCFSRRNDIGGVCGTTYSLMLGRALEGAFHPEVAGGYVDRIRVGPILQGPRSYTRFK